MSDESNLSADEAAALVEQLIQASPSFHFECSQQIEDKDNVMCRKAPNIYQRRLSETYETVMHLADLGLWDRGLRMLGLKPRQVGSSTFCAEIGHHHLCKYRLNGITMANLSRVSEKVFQKFKSHFDNDVLPDGRHVPKEIFGVSRAEVAGNQLRYSNGSFLEMDTAEQPRGGIGFTRQFALFSEAGRYPKTGIKNDEKTIQAILASLAKKPRSVGIAESTPEGSIGWFYKQWQKAITLSEFLAFLAQGKTPGVDEGTGNGWIKVFAGWYEFEEHRIRVSNEQGRRIMETLNERERIGVEKYGWKADQIAWRRYTIAEECGGDPDLFDQDYPEDDVLCWLAAGRPRFNIQAVAKLEIQAMGARYETGRLTVQEGSSAVFVPTAENEATVKIFERAMEGCRYLVTVDPATGEDQTEGRNPDATSIIVLRAPFVDDVGIERNMRQVARVRFGFRGDADQAAYLIEGLSRLYGTCMIVPEINMGHEVVRLLRGRGLPIYQREVFNENDPSNPQRKLGFKTKDANVKRQLVEALAAVIRDLKIDVLDVDTIRELKNFVTTAGGKDEARPGAHDDDVMALAIGVFSINAATMMRPGSRKRRKPKDLHHWTRTEADF